MEKNKIPTMNLGKLKPNVPAQNNIVYFRRGFDELSLNITNRCPNSCVFCIRDHNTGWGVSNLYLKNEPSNEKIVSEANKKIAQLKKSISKIKICGYGEPILRIQDIPKIIQGIERHFSIPTWQITTTGWPISLIENSFQHLLNAQKEGLTNIYLSMHSTTAEKYAQIVRPSIEPQIAFNQTIEFAKKCRDIGLEVTMAFLAKTKIDINLIKDFTSNLDCKYDIRKYE